MRKFLILAFVIFSLTGYLTVSRITTSQAQVCIAAGTPCILATPGMGALATALALVHVNEITPDITQMTLILEAYFQPLTIEFYDGMHPVMDWSIQELSDWFDTFWYYSLRPEMQQMTAQLSTANVEQAFAMEMFGDAANVDRTRRTLDDMAITDSRTLRPSEEVCTGGTLMSGMERATVFSDAYQAYGAGDKQWIAANSSGGDASHGFAEFLHIRWENQRADQSTGGTPVDNGGNFGYVPLWCNAAYNKGYAGCAKDGSRAGKDADIAGMIFAQDTIPLDPDQDPKPYYIKADLDEMVTNLAEFFGKDPVTAGLAGKDGILGSLSYRAKRQVVYDSLFYVISRRVPGGFRDNSQSMQPKGGGTYLVDLLREVRAETGEGASTGCGGFGAGCGSPDPSRNEVLRAMMTQRFQTGKYALSQIDEPENNRRASVIDQALQLMQMSDQLDLMDHWSLLLASQIGGQIVERTVFTSASPGAPLK